MREFRRAVAATNSTHARISPTETACNQIAPGPVCLKEWGRNPNRSGKRPPVAAVSQAAEDEIQ